jgi:ADP-ribose pyrophosphatase YjhB (NUDIX family)
MHLNQQITEIEQELKSYSNGLPEELFLFVSRLTPLVCVDLLIKDGYNRTLFTWRDDDIFGQGWHLPGGVIRHNEKIENRIIKVGELELGAKLEFDEQPITFVQDIDRKKMNRGHFIAFLYKCRCVTAPDITAAYTKGEPAKGEWAWFEHCPDPLLKVHEVYKPYF